MTVIFIHFWSLCRSEQNKRKQDGLKSWTSFYKNLDGECVLELILCVLIWYHLQQPSFHVFLHLLVLLMCNPPDCSFVLSSLLFLWLFLLLFFFFFPWCLCILNTAMFVRDAKCETNRRDRYATVCSANGNTLCTAASSCHKVRFLKHSTKQILPCLALMSVLTLLQCGCHIKLN